MPMVLEKASTNGEANAQGCSEARQAARRGRQASQQGRKRHHQISRDRCSEVRELVGVGGEVVDLPHSGPVLDVLVAESADPDEDRLSGSERGGDQTFVGVLLEEERLPPGFGSGAAAPQQRSEGSPVDEVRDVDYGGLVKGLAFAIAPDFLRLVFPLQVHRPGIPVVLFPGHVVAPLDKKDPLPGCREPIGQRPAARPGANDDVVASVRRHDCIDATAGIQVCAVVARATI